ncbi:uncharacterized protein LY89DRAFT_285964 [Mollisia scopiformis]|uniref:DUF8035 domain-containing protein n=1 Tax=Mollisia scopiformis TaxID=149040 RepID=A0A132BAE4_MOLSC|nr:uncharacterized protein LY89DRAFT_285964 [Mollisia scopiformis]KUJ09380.1 hypothetical protein LY89DRAFT_285964 [Mollisia scopiformis]
MSDRYSRYVPRRGSPPLFNPARASLPINLAYPEQQPHLHVVPSSRREIIAPARSSNSSASTAGTVTTTYKVTSEAPKHGSHVREGSRTRRSTIDNHNRPTIVTTTRAHRPVVHSGGGVRPASPMKNPYRSSEEEYVVTPATSSRHGHHHHKKHYSVTMDNADMNRLAREREDSRLRVVPVREPTYRARNRPVYTGSVVRHADTVADDYGDDGYGYTNPQDLVRYDLDRGTQPTPVVHRSRRDSFDGNRAPRPSSITGYNDIVPRSYDTRERGPPPSTRGFDKIRPPPYDQAAIRMPRPPSPGNSMAPMEPVARPPPFEPVEPVRRSNSTRARPTSYHDRDRPRGPRDDYYEVRDDERRHRHDSYDDRVESRGFGIRTDRPESRTAVRGERPIERPESRSAVRIEPPESRSAIRPERPESRSAIRPERSERIERSERNDRGSDGDRKEHKEHKGRDALATGLSLAGAALGINAVKNVARGDDRKDRDSDSDEREERRRREYDEEPRRRRDRDEREHVDLGGRDPKERRHRDDDMPPPPRDDSSRDPPPARSKDVKERSPTIDLGGRDPRERQAARDDRDSDKERRERHRQRSEAALSGTAVDSSDTGSDDAQPRPRREIHHRGNSTAAAAVGAAAGAAVAAAPAFNPKDTMDLKALKEALNSKDAAAKAAAPPKEPVSRTPRQSSTKDPAEVAKIREELKPERGRDPLASNDNRQLRVVSPPREKAEDKPVKGILRQPREKFPEDPAPIREGVAPLKDSKKDGIPPDARWTKISRKLVNPEALEAGKERFEAREDFVIVLRVLSRDEVQGYAEVTQRIRAAREELEEIEAAERRRARRERHERHKRERNGEVPREHGRRRREREHRDRSASESDTTDDEYDDGDRVSDKPKMIEAPKKRATFEDAMMTGGLGGDISVGSVRDPSLPMGGGLGSLREDPSKPGVYSGYVRNPPAPKQ